MKKVGIFLGSFDPIHVGHVNMIREALDWVDKIIVVPSGHNPWKENNPAPFGLRVAMIASAIEPFGDKVEVSAIEGTFEPPYYANKSLNYFRDKYKGCELSIICGSDTAIKIPMWKDASKDILPFYDILALERDEGKNGSGFACRWLKGEDNKMYMYTHVFITPLPVSSTLVRKLIKENKTVYPLIPFDVMNIINSHSLYKD